MVNIYDIKYINDSKKIIELKIYAENFRDAHVLCEKFHPDCKEIIKIEKEI